MRHCAFRAGWPFCTSRYVDPFPAKEWHARRQRRHIRSIDAKVWPVRLATHPFEKANWTFALVSRDFHCRTFHERKYSRVLRNFSFVGNIKYTLEDKIKFYSKNWDDRFGDLAIGILPRRIFLRGAFGGQRVPENGKVSVALRSILSPYRLVQKWDFKVLLNQITFNETKCVQQNIPRRPDSVKVSMFAYSQRLNTSADEPWQ